ncbi:unnamed protein product [Amoebophrya sp. A25]|nr:unnamed protein product [Amoebophrya sp. A25]|eukprot:GSA25T00012671001.1
MEEEELEGKKSGIITAKCSIDPPNTDTSETAETSSSNTDTSDKPVRARWKFSYVHVESPERESLQIAHCVLERDWTKWHFEEQSLEGSGDGSNVVYVAADKSLIFGFADFPPRSDNVNAEAPPQAQPPVVVSAQPSKPPPRLLYVVEDSNGPSDGAGTKWGESKGVLKKFPKSGETGTRAAELLAAAEEEDVVYWHLLRGRGFPIPHLKTPGATESAERKLPAVTFGEALSQDDSFRYLLSDQTLANAVQESDDDDENGMEVASVRIAYLIDTAEIDEVEWQRAWKGEEGEGTAASSQSSTLPQRVAMWLSNKGGKNLGATTEHEHRESQDGAPSRAEAESLKNLDVTTPEGVEKRLKRMKKMLCTPSTDTSIVIAQPLIQPKWISPSPSGSGFSVVTPKWEMWSDILPLRTNLLCGTATPSLHDSNALDDVATSLHSMAPLLHGFAARVSATFFNREYAFAAPWKKQAATVVRHLIKKSFSQEEQARFEAPQKELEERLREIDEFTSDSTLSEAGEAGQKPEEKLKSEAEKRDEDDAIRQLNAGFADKKVRVQLGLIKVPEGPYDVNAIGPACNFFDGFLQQNSSPRVIAGEKESFLCDTNISDAEISDGMPIYWRYKSVTQFHQAFCALAESTSRHLYAIFELSFLGKIAPDLAKITARGSPS